MFYLKYHAKINFLIQSGYSMIWKSTKWHANPGLVYRFLWNEYEGPDFSVCPYHWDTWRHCESLLGVTAPLYTAPGILVKCAASSLACACPLDRIPGKDARNSKFRMRREVCLVRDGNEVGCVTDVPIGLCSQDIQASVFLLSNL